MARKFIVVSGVDIASISKCFSVCGKAPRANTCPRFQSLKQALDDAQKWAIAGYCASILRPLKGGGWVEVAFMEGDLD